MTVRQTLTASALAAILGLAAQSAQAETMPPSDMAQPKPPRPALEKCYGVARAGKNDCATSKHSCHFNATVDGDPAEWISMPKGLCNKLVNGSLTPPAGEPSPATPAMAVPEAK